MDQADPGNFLAGTVVFLALGGLELTGLAAKGRAAWIASALIGAVSFLLYTAATGSVFGLASTAALAAGGMLAGVAGYVLVTSLIRLVRHFNLVLIDRTQEHLAVPALEAAGPAERDQQVARRWFVTVGAVTGSVVFALMSSPEFEEGLKKTFSPGAIFAVAVAAAASAVLEGPLRQFVFGNLPAEGAARPFPVDAMGLRGWLRLALLGGFFLALALLFNSLEEAVSAAAVQSAMSIVLVGVPSAIVTWYWCAFLQSGEAGQGLALKSWRGAMAAGTALYHPMGIALSLLIGLVCLNEVMGTPGQNTLGALFGAAVFLLGAPFAGLLPAGLLSAMTLGLPAWAGARILAGRTGWPAMLLLAAVLGACLALPTLCIVPFLPAEIRGETLRLLVPYQLFIAAGWVVGLVATGFPGLVRKARAPAAAIP